MTSLVDFFVQAQGLLAHAVDQGHTPERQEASKSAGFHCYQTYSDQDATLRAANRESPLETLADLRARVALLWEQNHGQTFVLSILLSEQLTQAPAEIREAGLAFLEGIHFRGSRSERTAYIERYLKETP